jgi:hypothetical protein
MTFNSSVVPLYYNSIASKLLKSYNIEQVARFEVPLNFGAKVRIPWLGVSKDQRVLPVNTWELKLRAIVCCNAVTDSQVLSGEPNILETALVDSILSQRSKWSYVATSRHYYLTDTAQVYIRTDDERCCTIVSWKCWYVVLPKQWRKKLWKARGGKVA